MQSAASSCLCLARLWPAHLSNEWLDCLNNRKEAKVIALDIKAAFDRVWHNGLVEKLEARGVNGKLLRWLKSYLSDRNIRVVVWGQSSCESSINASVPQGSFLGPSLFLAYNDDMCDDLINPAKLYADDGTVEHQEQCISSLNSDLSLINDWGIIQKPSR